MFCHKKFLLPGRSGLNGGSPGRAGRWAVRSGLRPSLQAQRPELNYKDNSFNLFLPLRVYFYECSKVQMRNNKCNSEIVQYKLRSFITKCSNLPYKMFKSLKDELCYLVEIQYYGRVVFTLTYSEYFGSLSAN